jgi:isocitrate dehydrogenase
LPLAAGGFRLEKISNRGIEVWPSGFPETFCTDHWCCRFLAEGKAAAAHAEIAALLARLGAAGLDFIKTENLCLFDGQKSYSG